MDTDSEKNEERFSAIEDRLSKIEKAVFVGNDQKNIQFVRKNKKLSAKEFLLEKNPKSELETTFLLGYYLEAIEGMEFFDVESLRVVFKSAKVSQPKNLNDSINKNIAKGYFMEAGSKGKGQKRWILTIRGEKHGAGNE